MANTCNTENILGTVNKIIKKRTIAYERAGSDKVSAKKQAEMDTYPLVKDIKAKNKDKKLNDELDRMYGSEVFEITETVVKNLSIENIENELQKKEYPEAFSCGGNACYDVSERISNE